MSHASCTKRGRAGVNSAEQAALSSGAQYAAPEESSACARCRSGEAVIHARPKRTPPAPGTLPHPIPPPDPHLVSAGAQQQVKELNATLAACGDGRGAPAVVAGVHVGSSGNQHLPDGCVIPVRRKVQRRVAVLQAAGRTTRPGGGRVCGCQAGGPRCNCNLAPLQPSRQVRPSCPPPTSSRALALAPLASSARQIPSLPLRDAAWSGVSPFWLAWLQVAGPARSSSSTASTLPLEAAQAYNRAWSPSPSSAQRGRGALSNSWTLRTANCLPHRCRSLRQGCWAPAPPPAHAPHLR